MSRLPRYRVIGGMLAASPISKDCGVCSWGHSPKEQRWIAAAKGILFALAILCLRTEAARAQANVLDAVIDALNERARQTPAAPETTESRQSGPRYIFHATIAPEPLLVLRFQELLAPYFDKTVDLTNLLRKMIAESAVANVPGIGQILYNPGHMLLLHVPEDWREGRQIRVAVLADVRDALKKERPANLLLAAYTQGFEEFALFSELMKDEEARATHEAVWRSSSPSEQEKERMRYLLLRPLEQAAAVAAEAPSCREVINHFVDDVRAEKRAAFPSMPGLTRIVKPVRLVRHDSDIVLVLGETLIARYYVFARFRVGEEGCRLAWEASSFAM